MVAILPSLVASPVASAVGSPAGTTVLAASSPEFAVVIGTVCVTGGQLEVHGLVDGRQVDTYPPDPAPLLALPDLASQQAYVSGLLIAAAQAYPSSVELQLASNPSAPLQVSLASAGLPLPLPAV